MAGLTPDEQNRISRVLSAISNPAVGSGDAFSIEVMVNLFLRIVKLRDFAEEQVILNQQLHTRVRQLEIRLGNHVVDDNEIYLTLSPAGESLYDQI
jgi:hypothetical protein